MDVIEVCQLCGYDDGFAELSAVPRESADIVLVNENVKWVNCPSCQFVFQPEQASEEIILKYYKKDYREQRSPVFPDINDIKVESIRAYRQYSGLTHGKIRITKTIDSVLDIGCNLGSFMRYMRERGNATTLMGVEPADLARKELERFGIPCVPTVYDLDDAQYKFVMLSHTLEHVVEPLKFLTEQVYPRVMPGQFVFVEVPHMLKSNAWSATHLSVFKTETLGIMMVKAGFYPLTLDRYGAPDYKKELYCLARRTL